MSDRCEPIREEVAALETQLRETPRIIVPQAEPEEEGRGPRIRNSPPRPNPEYKHLSEALAEARNRLRACIDGQIPAPVVEPLPSSAGPCDALYENANRLREQYADLTTVDRRQPEPGDPRGPTARPGPPAGISRPEIGRLRAELNAAESALEACIAAHTPPALPTTYKEEPILTPAGVALGGRVRATFWADGRTEFRFDLHDSGAIGYTFLVTARFVTRGGVHFVARFSGDVEGTADDLWPIDGGPRRDASRVEAGTYPIGVIPWDDLVNGRLWLSIAYENDGLLGSAVALVQDVAGLVADIAAGSAGLAVGTVFWVGSGLGQFLSDLGLADQARIVAGCVLIATGTGLILATVGGVAAGAVVDGMIDDRQISTDEYNTANARVFGGSLPPAEKIRITNLTGIGGRAFVTPFGNDKIYVNLGTVAPIVWSGTPEYAALPDDGARQRAFAAETTFIHELTHVWQVYNRSFLPGTVCAGFVNQVRNETGGSVYGYGPPGPLWSEFNLEAQASIVAHWYAGISVPTVPEPNRPPSSEADPYFVYIRDNIRDGRT